MSTYLDDAESSLLKATACLHAVQGEGVDVRGLIDQVRSVLGGVWELQEAMDHAHA